MKQNEEEYITTTMEEELEASYGLVVLGFECLNFNWDEVDEEDLEAIKEFNQLHEEEGIQAFYAKNEGLMYVLKHKNEVLAKL